MSGIAVFDYGAGNLRSVMNTLEAIGAKFTLVDDAAGLSRPKRFQKSDLATP